MKWWIKLRKNKDASCALPLLYINTNKPYAAKSLNEAAPPHPFTPYLSSLYPNNTLHE